MSITDEEIEKLETIMLDFGEAHNLLAKSTLSKEEYQPISGLLAKAKIELFNFKVAFQKKVSDPATEQSTANWGKVGDKDNFMDEVRGKESDVRASFEKILPMGMSSLLEKCVKISKEYASIVNRKDNVGVNDAIEFAEWIHSNYNEVRGRLHGWRKRNIDGEILSTEELYLIFRSESKQKNINQ